mmetsp:Transcript_2632/g.3716  ORF Transcript_2632/g.3716 Transcript_2632/m.3716 type:complete len:417 (-) Transcript_2632:42-1292(-)
MMRRIKLFASLLFFTIWNNSLKCVQGRPEVVPKAILKEGCPGWVDFVCPAHMWCYVDMKYPKFGQCHCLVRAGLYMNPPKYDDNELSDPPVQRTDCVVGQGILSYIFALFWFAFTFISVRLTYVGCRTLFVVKKNKGLKFNASSIGLFFLIIFNITQIMRFFGYGIMRVGLDPHFWYRDIFEYVAESTMALSGYLFVYEAVVTWFDVFQKSVTMSKRSSKLITALKIILRLWSLIQGAAYVLIRFIDGTNFAANLSLVTNSTNLVCTISVALSAFLITRVLCKNRKDVSNPNWKAAEAIRVSAMYQLAHAGLWALQIEFYVRYGINIMDLPTTGNSAFIGFYITLPMISQSWMRYFLFSHRRYLGSQDLNRVTNYFGFSTVGLKGGSLASAIGIGSSTSSAVSSTSISAKSESATA